MAEKGEDGGRVEADRLRRLEKREQKEQRMAKQHSIQSWRGRGKQREDDGERG